MFMGQYNHNLDDKGRIIIPSKFREKLNLTVVATKGFDGCISVYTVEGWESFLHELQKLPNNKLDARKYIRTVVGSASECEFDKQGRIDLPSNLLADAEITKECVIIGNLDHIEIWSKEKWSSYYEGASSTFEEIAEKLELGEKDV